MTSNPSISNKLDELKKRFKERLVSNKAEVSSWEDTDERAQLLYLSHKLAGSAGTFGFAQLSTEMRSFETRLYAMKDAPLSEGELHSLYQEFNALIDKALAD